MTIHLGCLLPNTSCDLPEQQGIKACPMRTSAVPIWSCSERGLPCRLCCQIRGGLLPRRFTLTPHGGGLFSVALSVGSRRPAVSRLSAFMEPGLSSPIPLRYGRGHPTLCVCEYIGVLGIINQFSCAPCSGQLSAFIVLTVHCLGIKVHKKCAPAFCSGHIRGIPQLEQ